MLCLLLNRSFARIKQLLDLPTRLIFWMHKFSELLEILLGLIKLQERPVGNCSSHKSFEIVRIKVLEDIVSAFKCIFLLIEHVESQGSIGVNLSDFSLDPFIVRWRAYGEVVCNSFSIFINRFLQLFLTK